MTVPSFTLKIHLKPLLGFSGSLHYAIHNIRLMRPRLSLFPLKKVGKWGNYYGVPRNLFSEHSVHAFF